jgi:CRISPR/Cas system-associated exonuclease Cas4 (RecB family)
MLLMNISNLLSSRILPLERLSPSRFWAMQSCALQEVFSKSTIPQLLPFSPDARLGSVIHKLIELAIKRRIENPASFFEIWDLEINKREQEMALNPLESHLIPLSKHTRNYEVKRQQCFNDAQQHFTFAPVSNQGNSGISSKKSEVWVESKDKVVAGSIDEVRFISNEIHLVDYKTGAVLDENETTSSIKMPYQVQMKLYAALYDETFDVFPTRLLIKTLNTQEFEVVFDNEECLTLLSQAKTKIYEVNKIIQKGEWETLAAPSPATCRYCQFRPVCKSYWQAKDGSGEWNLDFSGVVLEAKLLRNGVRVVIRSEDKEIAVRGLALSRNGELLESHGKTVLLLNLARDTSEYFYVEAPLTKSFVVES